MKKTLSLILTLLMYSLSFAQLRQIAEGPKFADPEIGFAKIIQLENGTTFYLSLFYKTGINIRIYDASHSQKVVTNISTVPISKFVDIEGIFEIDNNIVFFISDQEDHTPVLHRLTIDGATGKLVNKTQVAKLRRSGMLLRGNGSDNQTIITGEDPLRYFSVKKDPNSNNYAIACFDIETRERDKRIEIIHFDGQHREISRTFCAPDNDNKTFFLFMDMVVLGSEKVCAFLFESKGIYGFTYKGKMVMGTIEKSSAKVNYTDLDLGTDIYVNWGMAVFNAVSKKIIFINILRKSKGGKEYAAYANLIDPVNNKIQSLNQAGWNEKLKARYKEKFDKEPGILPQDVFTNDNGDFTVVYEEIDVTNIMESGKISNTTDTKLGSIIVVKYDKDGNLLSNYIIPKFHWVLDQAYYPFYHFRFRNAAPFLYNGSYYTNTGNHYKSFVYIDGVKKDHILFNDTERNNDITKKIVVVNKMTECNAFLYELAGDDVFTKRVYALENQQGSGLHSLLCPLISSYDKKNNIFVTLRLDKESKTDNNVKLVWLQPQ